MDLNTCGKLLESTRFAALAMVGKIFKSTSESLTFPMLNPSAFCPSSPSKPSLSVLSLLLWSWSQVCHRRNRDRISILTVILYQRAAREMPVAAWHMGSSAVCPRQSLPAIPPTNHSAWMWLCHWETKVPVECVGKACGCILFDMMTDPSCTAGWM